MIKINEEEKKATKEELKTLLNLNDYVLWSGYYIKYNEYSKVSTIKARKIINILRNFYSILNIEELIYYDFEILEKKEVLKIVYDRSIKDNLYYRYDYDDDDLKDLELLLKYDITDIIFLINYKKITEYHYLCDESIICFYYHCSLNNITSDDIIDYYNDLIDRDIDFIDYAVYNLMDRDFNNFIPRNNIFSKTYQYLNDELYEDLELINSHFYYLDPEDISFIELLNLENKNIYYSKDKRIFYPSKWLTLDYC